MITAQEIVDTVVVRNLDTGNFKAVDIEISGKKIKKLLGSELWQELDEGDHEGFLNDYVKKALAYTVFYDNFEELRTEITDRGINNFTGEGYAMATEEKIRKLKISIALKRDMFIGEMVAYAKKEIDSFKPEATHPGIISLSGEPKRVNHL